MDKVSCLSFLIYDESKNDEVRRVAKMLLIGDFTLKQVQNMEVCNSAFVAATNRLKKRDIDKQKLFNFIEENIYTLERDTIKEKQIKQ